VPYEGFEYTWERMKRGQPIVHIEIPKDYKKMFDVKEKTICFHVRESIIRKNEAGWYDSNYHKHEPERFVTSEPYIKLAVELANDGWNIIVLGDKGSTAFPKHKNIFNLCHLEDKTLMDDFYAVSKCDYIVASTSCMQVAGRAFGKKVLHSDNVHPHERWWFGDINLFKKLIHRESDRLIPNEEFIQRWGMDPFKIPFYPARSNEYRLVDCSYEDIKKGLQELMNL